MKVFILVCMSVYDYEESVSIEGVFSTLEDAKKSLNDEYENEVDEAEDTYGEDFECYVKETEAGVYENGDYTRNHIIWKIFEDEVK